MTHYDNTFKFYSGGKKGQRGGRGEQRGKKSKNRKGEKRTQEEKALNKMRQNDIEHRGKGSRQEKD